MKILLKKIPVILLFLLLTTACNNQGENKESQKNEGNETTNTTQHQEKDHSVSAVKNEDPVVEPLPTTYQELAKLPVGEYYNIATSEENSKKEIPKVFSDLPDISGNPSEKELDLKYS